LILKGHSLDKSKDSVSVHSDVNTHYEYLSTEHYALKDNPILSQDDYDALSGEKDNWATPKILIARLEKEFGKFDLDVCASEKNKVCESFFSYGE